jgi:hypothetical protein
MARVMEADLGGPQYGAQFPLAADAPSHSKVYNVVNV